MTQERKLFGTDGIRGEANKGYMTADIALKLGRAVSSILPKQKHKLALIGKDTRLSCYMIEPAITAGLVSAGVDVILLGPIPTPAVAILTKSMRADIGIMISASHNPFMDNGIKIFNNEGYKISDSEELIIEQSIFTDSSEFLVSSDRIGRVQRLEDAKGRYIEYIKNSFPKNLTLAGLKIAIDAANGAAYGIAGKIFWELGAEIVNINNSPNGININEECGATHPQKLIDIVCQEKCDIGIGLDGDADRIIIIDEKGNIIDGDQIIALIATHMLKENKLRSKTVVTTVMSNLGLEHYLNSLDIQMIRSKVGDRYVLEEMKKRNCNLGGEQSGHIIMTDYGTTGDGLIAALQILSVMVKTQKKSSDIFNLFQPYIQLKENLKIDHRLNQLQDKFLVKITQETEALLGKNNRVLIRKSGTESILRIMVEGQNYTLLAQAIKDLIAKLYLH
jgi:phosphoglucosamine mutase